MKFKEGDRVHVLRFLREEVDFYATMKIANDRIGILTKCTDAKFAGRLIALPTHVMFGEDRRDYYVLAEDEPTLRWSDGSSADGEIYRDEEDTEEPVIQHTKDNVNHPEHYNYGEIEIIDFIEQVSEHYNPVVAVHIANAIKYLSRAPHKNGKEDIEKAR